jgi:hypothetical protein
MCSKIDGDEYLEMGRTNRQNYSTLVTNFKIQNVTEFNNTFGTELDPGEVAYVVCTAFKRFKRIRPKDVNAAKPANISLSTKRAWIIEAQVKYNTNNNDNQQPQQQQQRQQQQQ